MEAIIVVFIIIVLVIIFVIYEMVKQSNRKNEMEQKLQTLPDFKATQKLMSVNGNSGIAIDDEAKKVCLIKHQSGDISHRVFSYRDILASEVVEDGHTTTKTSRGSQIGGALLGGIVFGGAGAVIGGLSGRRSTTEKVLTVELRVVVNDIKDPVHAIHLLAIDCEKSTALYRMARQNADYWHSLITVLIKQADREDEALQNKSSGQMSVADELLKLSSLLEKGFITSEEFQTQKARLLSEGETGYGTIHRSY